MMVNNVVYQNYQLVMFAIYNFLSANNNLFDYMKEYIPFHLCRMDNPVYDYIVLPIEKRKKKNLNIQENKIK